MSDKHPARGTVEAPVGEEQGQQTQFSVAEIATAFGVDSRRVQLAVAGEFGESTSATFDSGQAQHLAEVILGDKPLDRRQAALMELGAFTPRSDADFGLGDAPPGEESDLLASDAEIPPTERASPRSSHDPATQPTR